MTSSSCSGSEPERAEAEVERLRRELGDLEQEVTRLQRIVNSLAARVVGQSELLTSRAERKTI